MCVLHVPIYRATIQAVKRYPELIVSTLRTANLLGALAGEVSNRLERLLKNHPNQTDSAAAALNTIALYEGCSNPQLSQTLRLSHPATVRLVDKLAVEGAVERRGTDDKRAVALYLTKRGRARAKAILVSRCEALRDIVSPLSVREREQLSKLMEKLLRPMVATVSDGDYICRLCDSVACPPENCPVHTAAIALASA
jgi:DNA-binding MarR family transcriptional regulator